MTNVTAPGFKNKKGTILQPFSAYFFQDVKGKNGVLYRTKEILKTRHGAKFFENNGNGDFKGPWWYISSNISLEEIYKLLQ
ncbi:MAG: hypothetical protein HQK79_23155 [Desulfobacterales bacterium]|nr:hypothetical protein [Desulfobacterales bacterium]